MGKHNRFGDPADSAPSSRRVPRLIRMRPKLFLTLILTLAGLLLPWLASAQADGVDMPLGDLARSLRKNKGLADHTVIDNDNISQVMEEVQNRKLNGSKFLFSIDESGKGFKVSSPDVTCSLSFSAQAAPLLSEPFISQNLPDSELPKLDGPASVIGDALQVSLYNGTTWNIREIVVGLTIVRRGNTSTAQYGSARLLPAAAGDVSPPATEKRSDVTFLIHLRGAAPSLATTVFRQSVGAALSPDQEWHWAIVEAKGIPPQPAAAPDPNSQPPAISN